MPCVVVSRSVDLAQLVLRRLDLAGSVLCGIASNVSQENSSVGEELPELAVGDEQSAEGAQILEGFVPMLLRCLLIDRRSWGLRIAASDLLGLPDKVLKQISLILSQNKGLGLLNDVPKVRNELLAVGG